MRTTKRTWLVAGLATAAIGIGGTGVALAGEASQPTRDPAVTQAAPGDDRDDDDGRDDDRRDDDRRDDDRDDDGRFDDRDDRRDDDGRFDDRDDDREDDRDD